MIMHGTVKKLFLKIELPKVELYKKMAEVYRSSDTFYITLPQRISGTTFDYYCYVIVENNENIDRILCEAIEPLKRIPEHINCHWEQD